MPAPPSPGLSDDALLSAAITDYTLMRDDERNHVLALGALLTLAVALGTGEAALVVDSSRHLSNWVYAIAPAPLVGSLAYVTLLGTEAVSRYLYMVALEREISGRLVDGGDGLLPPRLLPVVKTPFFAFQRARYPLVIPSQKHPYIRFPFPLLIGIAAVGAAALPVSVLVGCITRISPLPVAVLIAAIYFAPACLIAWSAFLGWGNRRWDRQVWEHGAQWFEDDGSPMEWRGDRVMPRPKPSKDGPSAAGGEAGAA